MANVTDHESIATLINVDQLRYNVGQLEAAAGPSSSATSVNGGLDDEAYEPTYTEAFPPLPMSNITLVNGNGNAYDQLPPSKSSLWNRDNSMMAVKASTITQLFHVPMEERRFKELKHNFGTSGDTDQAKICHDIMLRTNTHIEICSSKDEALTIMVTGKPDAIQKARCDLLGKLQTQSRAKIIIPKAHHRFILGKGAIKLKELESSTATKIYIPRADDATDVIQIAGPKDGIDKATHEIQLISDIQAKLKMERLPIEKMFHIFIRGPRDEHVTQLSQQTGARINIPPPSLYKDEITVTGEIEGVQKAVNTINRIYQDLKSKLSKVSVQIKRSQHKYIIGPRGSGIQDILSMNGVSVEVPPSDSDSETITLRGEPEKLGNALTHVYSRANSFVEAELEAPGWLHRFIIGKSGQMINELTAEFDKVHVEFSSAINKITLEGPPDQLAPAKANIEAFVEDLQSKMAFDELKIDPKFHRHIIGKGGVNINRLKSEHNVSIRIPNNDFEGIIRIEGNPEGVRNTKNELLAITEKLENEKSKDTIIEQRFHRTLIGAGGERIKELRERFPNVNIQFPDAGKKSDIVCVRGPNKEVDLCCNQLRKLADDLLENSYKIDVVIFKRFHKNVIGKGGCNIRKIREETNTKIDLPNENASSDLITITGKKENVLLAKKKISAIQNELVLITEVDLEIPHKFHTMMIGPRGKIVQSIMEECGGVQIHFPTDGKSNTVQVKGPDKDVAKATELLMEMANEKEQCNYTGEVTCKPELHKFLIGRGGSNLNFIKDNRKVRFAFPTLADENRELIHIIGKKEDVEFTKNELEQRILSLNNIVEDQVNVDVKHHRYFVARRGQILKDIQDEFGGISISFPKAGADSTKVVLRGAKQCVEAAKQRVLEIVDDLNAQVTITVDIPKKHHRALMGSKGSNMQHIVSSYNVTIKLPDRNDIQQEDSLESNDIVITGRQENCDAAKQALFDSIPVELAVTVPFEFHGSLIGPGGSTIRSIMSKNDVHITIPPPSHNTDIISVIGLQDNVSSAEKDILLKIKEFEEDKEDKIAKKFSITINVKPAYHPKIIGRKGVIVNKIRNKHDVNIKLPEQRSANSDEIIISGYPANVEAAKEDILDIVGDLEGQVTQSIEIDARLHPRLIGRTGVVIRKTMELYKVEIRFPRMNDDNKNNVDITGKQDDVADVIDYLLNQAEEMNQDLIEDRALEQYLHPPSRESLPKPDPRGFTVRDAPWSHVPDSQSNEEFPNLGTSVATNSVWPKFKQ